MLCHRPCQIRVRKIYRWAKWFKCTWGEITARICKLLIFPVTTYSQPCSAYSRKSIFSWLWILPAGVGIHQKKEFQTYVTPCVCWRQMWQETRKNAAIYTERMQLYILQHTATQVCCSVTRDKKKMQQLHFKPLQHYIFWVEDRMQKCYRIQNTADCR